ncbi:MAG: acyl carrier protein [Firmicutes bacterium]|mgnify:CR=1 FL=1|jgi:acyl carrier protein|nr:acyl carrier protein [Bacillota bacterium]
MSDKLFLQVRKMIAEHLNKDEEQITLESSFRDDLGADSLDLVEMIMGMEEMFDIEIDEGEAESIKTVGDAIRFIKKHIE